MSGIARQAFVLPVMILLAALSAMGQTPGPARSISLVADRTTVIMGESMQIRAATRDGNGLRRPPESFVWASLNTAVMTVDNRGLATAVGLGVSTISATISGLRTTIIMQVVPARLSVVAPREKMFVGEEMQLDAIAFDVNDVPIPNVAFRWDLSGANGGITRAASVSSGGLMRAVANALITAKATVVYPGVQSSQASEFSGVTHVLIEPRIDFKLTPLLRNDPVEGPFKIQPSYSPMGGNDQGQLVFVAPLDGISSAVMLYDAGKLDVLATSGSPGPQPGSFIWSFQNPAINNKGVTLFKVSCNGSWPSSGLMLASREGASYVVVEGQLVGGLQAITNFNTTRYSINDKSEILFRADFRYLGSNVGRSGLFKIVDGYVFLALANDTPLPGLGLNYSFGFFGMAQDGTVFFVASDGLNSGLYRMDESYQPVKVVATSDALAGSKVNYFVNWTGFGISANGALAFNVNLANGASGIARLRPGATQLETAIVPNGATDVYTVAPNGDVVFLGGDVNGWGLHVWGGQERNNIFSPVLTNNMMVDGGNIWTYFDAFVTRTGDVYSHLITSNNEFVVVHGSAPTVAFKAGATVNVKTNFDFLNVIPGARGNAPPVVSAGGQDVGILQLNGQSTVPLYTSGQRMASDTNSPWPLSNAVRNPAGDLYFTHSGGLYRNVAGKVEALQRTQTNVASTTKTLSFYKLQWFQGSYNATNTLAVNAGGAAVTIAQSDQGPVVVYADSKSVGVIASLGGNAPTPSPAGGFFNGFIWGAAVAIDDSGRVMFGGIDRSGRQGLFLYENATWKTAALANSTLIDGRPIANVAYLQAANNKFYAQFGLNGGDTVIAEYANGSWTHVVGRGDIMPNGSDVNFVWPRFDINRNGDMAYLVNMNSGQAVMLRTADGVDHFVYLTSDPEFQGDRLVQFGNTSFDLRDDRRLYFTAIDLFDRNVLLLAEPQF